MSLEIIFYCAYTYCKYKTSCTGKITMADVDKKVAKKLCALRVEDGIRIVKRFGMFNLDHMANKSAFLLSQIVMFRQQKGHYNHPAAFSANGIPGPDPEKMTVRDYT